MKTFKIQIVVLALFLMMALVTANAMPREYTRGQSVGGAQPTAPTLPSAQTVSPNGDTVIGVDVYHGDTIDFPTLRVSGASFVFIKATEGASIVDPHFSANWTHAGDAGLVRGAYCFFHPKVDAQEQAKKFLAVLPALHRGDLVVLDLETPDEWKDMPQQARIDAVMKWIQVVESELYMQPIIYCSRSFSGNVLGSNPQLATYQLWQAEYAVEKPTVPPPWQKWTLWQWTETGSIAGLAGNGNDLDAFNGSQDELHSLADSLRIQHAKSLLRAKK